MPSFSYAGSSVTYTDQGVGQPILMIAGLGGRHVFWGQVSETLAQEFRLISFDHPGCGQSERASGEISISFLTGLCLALLDELKIDRAHVVGHSMGGLIAQTMALDYPNRVDKLILSATWSRSDYFFDKSFAQRVNILKSIGIEAYVSATALLTIAPDKIASDPDAVQTWEAGSIAGSGSKDVILERIAALLPYDRLDEIENIKAETMVVMYEDDLIVPPHMSRNMHRHLADASLKTLDAGGHFGPSYCPAAYTQAIAPFLSGSAQEPKSLLPKSAPPKSSLPKSAPPKSLLMIGCGAIGQFVLEQLPKDPYAPNIAVLIPAGREDYYQDLLGSNIRVASSLSDLSDMHFDFAIEFGGHAALAANGPAILEAGIDLGILSTGALGDQTLAEDLKTASNKGGGKPQLLPGALGGLDVVSSLANTGLENVKLRTSKAPQAWKGTAAESAVCLDKVVAPQTFFKGSARDAARMFPKNANVAASLAFAGIGLHQTSIELIADPTGQANQHHIIAEGTFGSVDLTIRSHPLPANPKTSGLAAASALAAIRDRFGMAVSTQNTHMVETNAEEAN